MLFAVHVIIVANGGFLVNRLGVVFLQHLNTSMIVVNLQQIGPCMPRWCSKEELALVLQVAEDITAQGEPDALAATLSEWETALAWRSLDAEPVDDEWYYRALLLTCIRGLRGEMTPQFYTIDS